MEVTMQAGSTWHPLAAAGRTMQNGARASTYGCLSMVWHVVKIMQQLDHTYLISYVFTVGYRQIISVKRERNMAAPFYKTFDSTY